MSLALGHPQWDVLANPLRALLYVRKHVYGESVTKRYKSFMATHAPAAGYAIHVVPVKQEHGWHALYCTDPHASVVTILEAFADQATIEQDFHDV